MDENNDVDGDAANNNTQSDQNYTNEEDRINDKRATTKTRGETTTKTGNRQIPTTVTKEMEATTSSVDLWRRDFEH